MPTPKKITIFLTDGEPNGLKTAELSNWVGKAIVIPRNKLKDVKVQQEHNKPAIYFLIGKENEEDLLPKVYIGEAEILWDRLSTHDGSKDFWQTAIAFTSKDTNLTKAHVKYLESRCVSIANNTKRCNLENGVAPSLPSLPDADKAEMEEFLDNLKLLLSALGYSILREIVSKEITETANPIFRCSGKDAEATGRMTNDGFVVYQGSTLTTNFSKAVEDVNKRLIEKLLTSGHIKNQSEKLYIFIKDYVFNSPSAASSLILGNATNGWDKWKTETGKTLHEIFRTNIEK